MVTPGSPHHDPGATPEAGPVSHPGTTRHVVVMGVSGAGKTTVAKGISAVTGLLFAEADDFHSRSSVEKMSAGVPLGDGDRWPWLRDLAAWMEERAAAGESTVLACSALKRVYRKLLASGAPCLDFVHLTGSPELIRERMSSRPAHYMPPSLLESQITTLEPLHPDERGLVLDVTLPPSELVERAVRGLRLPCRRTHYRSSQ